MTNFKIKLMESTGQSMAVAGALGCFEEKSSAEIYQELIGMPEEERLKKEKAVLKNSFGVGHGSVGDQNLFIFSIENLPRTATLELCLPQYLEHLQQSLRRAKASRGWHVPPAIYQSKWYKEFSEIMKSSFELYEQMVEDGIPGEDARFILPLFTLTNIQTAGNARELCHLHHMIMNSLSPAENKNIVSRMKYLASQEAPSLFENFGGNYEPMAWYPSAQLFAMANPYNEALKRLDFEGGRKDVMLIGSSIPEKLLDPLVIDRAVRKRDESAISFLKHIHFTFIAQMSLTAFHQAIRQRTWDHAVESIYDALDEVFIIDYEDDCWLENICTIPPSIKKKGKWHKKYISICRQMLDFYFKVVNSNRNKIPREEVVGVLPHAFNIYTMVHINGWNAIHSIGKRTCTTAQWEIRSIAKKMAAIMKKKAPALGKWCEPQCIIYGACPEKEGCGYHKKRK